MHATRDCNCASGGGSARFFSVSPSTHAATVPFVGTSTFTTAPAFVSGALHNFSHSGTSGILTYTGTEATGVHLVASLSADFAAVAGGISISILVNGVAIASLANAGRTSGAGEGVSVSVNTTVTLNPGDTIEVAIASGDATIRLYSAQISASVIGSA